MNYTFRLHPQQLIYQHHESSYNFSSPSNDQLVAGEFTSCTFSISLYSIRWIFHRMVTFIKPIFQYFYLVMLGCTKLKLKISKELFCVIWVIVGTEIIQAWLFTICLPQIFI
jgi:hypothetical protein